MTHNEVMAKFITRLSLLKFFPAEPELRLMIIEMVEAFAETDEQVEWLGRRMISGIYQEWPGIHELRACFCNRYRPKDGISVFSTVYPEGLPPDPTAPKRIESAPQSRLGPVTEDPVYAAAIAKAAEAMTLRPVSRRRSRAISELRAILEPALDSGSLKQNEPTPQVFTHEDIERALAANRERKEKGVVEFWKEPV